MSTARTIALTGVNWAPVRQVAITAPDDLPEVVLMGGRVFVRRLGVSADGDPRRPTGLVGPMQALPVYREAECVVVEGEGV